MFGAIDVAAFAGQLYQTHFLLTVPALVSIGLYLVISWLKFGGEF